MKYGLDVPTAGVYADPRTLADFAVEAEQAGWDGFFLSDMFFTIDQSNSPVIDLWMALVLIALRTHRIRIGPFLTPLARRRPWQVARQTVTLDHLSNGRLIFGAALGFQARDFLSFGEDYDPKVRAEKLDEALAILEGLWSGETFSFAGKQYQVKDVTLLPKPRQQPRIPIWLAGGWPKYKRPLRRAARWDGIYLDPIHQLTGERLTPEEVGEVVTYVKTFRQSADPFDVAINGVPPADAGKRAELIHRYSKAGATWWIEAEPPSSSLEAFRERIRQGPSGER